MSDRKYIQGRIHLDWGIIGAKCTCGSGYPPGPLHDNYPWYTCPFYDDSPAPGSRAEKEAELERAKKGEEG